MRVEQLSRGAHLPPDGRLLHEELSFFCPQKSYPKLTKSKIEKYLVIYLVLYFSFDKKSLKLISFQGPLAWAAAPAARPPTPARRARATATVTTSAARASSAGTTTADGTGSREGSSTPRTTAAICRSRRNVSLEGHAGSWMFGSQANNRKYHSSSRLSCNYYFRELRLQHYSTSFLKTFLARAAAPAAPRPTCACLARGTATATPTAPSDSGVGTTTAPPTMKGRRLTRTTIAATSPRLLGDF